MSGDGSQGADIHVINTYLNDVEWFYYISQQSTMQHRTCTVWPVLDLYAQPQPKVEHKELVDYFQTAAHRSLITFAVDTSPIRDSVLRMALARDAHSGLAIFYAILAISSLCRRGLHQEAVQYKLAAIHVLFEYVKGGSIGPADAAQHVAACMLLAAFEVRSKDFEKKFGYEVTALFTQIITPHESSGEWLRYVRMAADLIQRNQLEVHLAADDVRNVLDWAHYQSALSKFTTAHTKGATVKPNSFESDDPDIIAISQLPTILDYPSSRTKILNLLSTTFDTIIDPRSQLGQSEGYKDRLVNLKRIIQAFPVTPLYNNTSPCPKTTELYRIVTIIYLYRASQGFLQFSEEIESLTNRAYSMPNEWPCCFHFFPVLILSCEARTEERRLWILRLLKRSSHGPRGRELQALRIAVQSLWVQQDLHADSDVLINYYGLISSVVSSSSSLTPFV
ncbi:unnamed protein product [Clonostachys byssicola]|uniref:Uncharacterized protein n=1 Tax=Clonostachys byssicola TaxID=160290 RepID=A0A9N9U900_9HYPO|nr:unnamed protein product [Clonostachys byssicola]